MAQGSHVPKFGNWEEGEENVPYTIYFDKARKGRSDGKMINPNDPQDNPEEFSSGIPPVQAPPFRTGVEPEAPVGPGKVRPKHERRSSREDGDIRQPTDSPAHHDTTGRKASTDLPHQRPGETPKRTGRLSGGSDRSVEHSPLHPHYQARVTGNRSGVSSPSWERKGSSEGSHGLASSTPGRSRLRSAARGDETPDRGAAVPKFGEWDENNPSSADEFTHIFNKVREEKQSGSANVLGLTNDSSHYNGQKQNNNKNSPKVCCFPWGRK